MYICRWARCSVYPQMLCNQLSGLMGETAKRVVETTGIPQDMSALRGRLEVAEERLSIMSEKSVRALEEQLHNLRTEVICRSCFGSTPWITQFDLNMVCGPSYDVDMLRCASFVFIAQ